MRSPLALSAAALTVLLLAGAVACGGGEAAPEGEPPPGSAPGVSPVAPISSRDATPPPGAPGPGAEAPPADPIQWALPPGWREEPPTSTMRLAQASIPGPGGAGELAIFQFAGGVGGVEANLDRWAGQMQGGGEPERGSFESGPYTVTWLDAAGTYDPGTMSGGATGPQPGWRMLAAFVEGPGGPWVFKATGPEETMAAARDDFFALLRSIRPAG